LGILRRHDKESQRKGNRLTIITNKFIHLEPAYNSFSKAENQYTKTNNKNDYCQAQTKPKIALIMNNPASSPNGLVVNKLISRNSDKLALHFEYL
jgi:hypothetical protein